MSFILRIRGDIDMAAASNTKTPVDSCLKKYG